MPHASLSIVHQGPPTLSPEAFRWFVEGLERFQDYGRTDSGTDLNRAAKAFDEALTADPNFDPARFHKALVLTDQRKADEAIRILEDLNRPDVPYQIEVCYSLAYAYSRKYELASFRLADQRLEQAETLGKNRGRRDVVLLARALRVFLYALFGGQMAGNRESFETRKRKYLPLAVEEGEKLLQDRELSTLDDAKRRAVLLEVHNGLGIAYMRMGRSSVLFSQREDELWGEAEKHYNACLSMQPRSANVLSNLGTLRLLQGHSLYKADDRAGAEELYRGAQFLYRKVLDINPFDRFYHYRLSQLSVLLGNWEEAARFFESGQAQPGAVAEQRFEALRRAISERNADILRED
jgi:tetratricopeptide (TPR) repeat protein